MIKRIEAECTISGGTIGSYAAQGLSGAGQIAAQILKPSNVNAALTATTVATGVGVVSSIVLFAASLKGLHTTSKELSKNRKRQADIQEILGKLGSLSSDSEKTVIKSWQLED